MKRFPLILCLMAGLTAMHPATAQEKNPLIHSGELMDKGAELYDSGEYKRSIDLYDKIDRNDTNYVFSLYETALSYFADSQYNKSIHYCQMAFAAEKGAATRFEPDIYDTYGNSVSAGGDPQKALGIFDTAIRKYPAYSLLYLNKGAALIKLERDKEAETLFQQGVLMDPYSYSSHMKLGIAALRQGKLIPAMLCFISYLLLNPEGKYHGYCIQLLGSISRNEDDIQGFLNRRKEIPAENYQLLEQIIQSKIALDKNYKPIIHLDDQVSRQIQVLFEKMQYEEGSDDFYMQYYMPYLKSVFTGGQFELFINHIFAGVGLPVIQGYLKKNKKEEKAFILEAANYFNLIRSTREIDPKKRNLDSAAWYFSDGKPVGKGRTINNGDELIGPWEFCYEYGNSKTKGLYNENGKKEGPWNYYYFDGSLKGKEFYQDGKQLGEETYYYDNGLPSSHSWYKDNQPDGESVSYFQTGAIQYIAHYAAGKEEGEKKTFYNNGGISFIETYKAGQRDGKVSSWNQNGTLDYMGEYVNGKLEGPYKKFFNNGQLASEGMYSKDQATGPWKYYFESGKLKQEVIFVEGRAEGAVKDYYENGQLDYTYAAKKGKADGTEQFYDEDGRLYAQFLHSEDKLVSAKYMDKSGKLISQSEIRQRQIDLTTFDAAGVKTSQSMYNEHGNNEGMKTYFYPSGAISQTETYKDGDLDGITKTFYPDGRNKEEQGYVHGEKDGYTKTWYPHGQQKAEGWYVKNLAQGYWLFYDELGDLTDSIYYYNDDINGYRGQFLPGGRKEYETEYEGGWMTGCTQYDSTGREIRHIALPGGSGRYTLIYPNGATYLDATYIHGNLTGTRKTYFFDGKLKSEEYFKNGLQDSVERTYAHSGKLRAENGYHAGDKTGTWKSYGDDDKLSATEEYREGQLNGKRIYYYPNGNKEEESSFKDDELDGPLKKYDPSGALLYQLTYKEGKLLSYTYQDKNGTLLKEIPVDRETARIKTFFPDGTVSAGLEFRDGYQEGAFTLYYTNGKLRKASTLHLDLTEGPYKAFYPNGQLKLDYTYLHNNLHGHYKEYNEKGILTEEGDYHNGSPHGVVKHFDDNGALTETDTFYYGKLLSVKK